MRVRITRRFDIGVAAIGALLMGLSACTPPRRPVPSEPPIAAPLPTAPAREGVASWYGADFHGNRTASGERFDKDELTAAHRSLPLGSQVRVTNLANGRAAVVRITDRGPWVRGREIDVSHAAARKLGMIDSGTARVRIQPLGTVQHAALVSAPPPQTHRRSAHRRRHAAPTSTRRHAHPQRTASAQAR